MSVADKATKRRFLAPFAGRGIDPPPIWLMRQAGRYLPEYRAVRAKAGGFLNLCYSPALAAEVTLQPIRRYGFDAAILFSDILVVPDALGQKVEFVEGEGPRLEPVRTADELARLDKSATRAKYEIVCETVARLRQDLPHETALIGFCGAPWTVATYMVAGRGTPDQADARLWAYRDPQGFGRLIDLLTETSIEYLSMQASAGADALQIFDTWAGSLPPRGFSAWVVEPTRRIVEAVRGRHPHVPDHRLSARGGPEDRRVREADGCAGDRLRHRHGRRGHGGAGADGQRRRAGQSGPAGPGCRRTGNGIADQYLAERRCAACRMSSTSGTASFPRRRRRTWRGSSNWCAVRDIPG